MKSELIEALKKHQEAFGLDLSAEVTERLDSFYSIVCENNPLLHLVGKCDPEEFAIRHILESLFVLDKLETEALFTDIGSGAGLPGIPLLIAERSLRGRLVESKEKKAAFLKQTIEKLGIDHRTTVLNKQFAETKSAGSDFVLCRAIDGFAKKVGRMSAWAGNSRMILFAGDAVRKELQRCGLSFSETLIPCSEKRFVFEVKTSRDFINQ